MTPPEWRRLLRRGSVTDTAIRPSQFMDATKAVPLPARVSLTDGIDVLTRTFRPPSNRHPAFLVAQTDPFRRTSPLNPIFMLGGAPTAHEFLTETWVLARRATQKRLTLSTEQGRLSSVQATLRNSLSVERTTILPLSLRIAPLFCHSLKM